MRRGLLVAALLAGLVADGAAWSHAFATGQVITARLHYYPETMQGQQVSLPLVKVVALRDDGYDVRQGSFVYNVYGDPGALQVGDEAYVRGVFSGTHRLDADWHALAPERRGKKLLGFVGLAVAGVVTAAGVRLGDDGLLLRG